MIRVEKPAVIARFIVVFALITSACAGIGHRQVLSQVEKPSSRPAKSPRIVVIAIDGLRTDTIDRYLRQIRDDDFEPNWQSGLSRLALDGFQFAGSNRAETTVPSTDMAAMASLATGLDVGQHGIVGRHFLTTDKDGTRTEYDFRAPIHAGGIWYAELGGWPGERRPALAQDLIRASPWWAVLGQYVRIGIAFFPFGQPAQWHIPVWRRAAVLAATPHPGGALAIPLLDQAAQASARQLLHEKHDVVLVRFRGVEGASCFQRNARCLGTEGDLAKQQDRAFRKLDVELASLVRQYRITNDIAYQNTTFIIVGTTGSDALKTNQTARMQRAYSPSWTLDQLRKSSTTQACKDLIESAQREQRLAITTDGGFLQVYLPWRRPGQTVDRRRSMACLVKAARSILSSSTNDWLSAVAWRAALDEEDAFVQAESTHAELSQRFAQSIPNHRRARLIDKIHALWTTGGPSNTGDLLLFSRPNSTFENPGGPKGDVYTTHGNLSTAAMSVPFLVVSRHLADDVASQLSTTAVDLQDVGPTVSHILGQPAPALSTSISRPPVLRWRRGKAPKLEIMRANRQATRPPQPTAPRIIWSEDDKRFRLSLQEAKSNWPPDRVSLAFGDEQFIYDPDGRGFANDAPCTFDETETTRRWQCDYKIARTTSRRLKARAERTPHPTSDGHWHDEFEVFVGPADLKLSRINALCATSNEVRVELTARSRRPISTIRLFMHPIDRVGRIPLGSQVAKLAMHAPQRPCTSGGHEATCFERGDVHSVDLSVALPYRKKQYEQFQWANDLRVPAPGGQGRTAALPAEAMGAREGYFITEVCTVDGTCATKATMADVRYEAAISRGCPTP
ncbi:MAG: alkaline phosphatase family protein [Myxococcota bacterium]|nr:alkaline phosphatase family protein [Myxococcota bacterium]